MAQRSDMPSNGSPRDRGGPPRRGRRRALLSVALLCLGAGLSGCGGGSPSGMPSAPAGSSPSPSPSPPVPTPAPAKTPGPAKTPAKKPTFDRKSLVTSIGSAGVALTFDDGPHPVWTPKVLDYLKARGVKATFCVIGQQAKAHPDLIRRIVEEGHAICNHSWGHELKLGTMSDARIRQNLQRTNDAIHAAVPGVPVMYFRHPGGNWTAAAVRIAGAMGMRSLDWAVDPRDWSRPGAAAISGNVIKYTRQGSVVLMHDGGGDRAQTLAALPRIISTLRERYRLVPMPGPGSA